MLNVVGRYPGTTFIDHILRYQDNVDVKMIVVLGEVLYSVLSFVMLHLLLLCASVLLNFKDLRKILFD